MPTSATCIEQSGDLGTPLLIPNTLEQTAHQEMSGQARERVICDIRAQECQGPAGVPGSLIWGIWQCTKRPSQPGQDFGTTSDDRESDAALVRSGLKWMQSDFSLPLSIPLIVSEFQPRETERNRALLARLQAVCFICPLHCVLIGAIFVSANVLFRQP